jgi:hypothetical protein
MSSLYRKTTLFDLEVCESCSANLPLSNYSSAHAFADAKPRRAKKSATPVGIAPEVRLRSMIDQ